MDNINIIFLGTSACDFNPRLKTDLQNTFDKDARRSSSILIDKKYLVDCGNHTLNSLEIINFDISKISDIFITHLHDDHFNADAIEQIALIKKEPLTVWVRDDAKVSNMKNVDIKKMQCFQNYTFDDYTVKSVPANHTDCPQHFIFEKGGTNFFYGLDGAWFLNDSFRFMRKMNFDLMVLDGTIGEYDGDLRIAEHNSLNMIKTFLPSLKSVGITDDKTQIYISHLAPSLHKSHDKTCDICRKFDVNVAFDGLELSIETRKE